MDRSSRTRTWGNSVRGIAQKLLAFFQGFTEADARALLSAYGLYEFEIDYLRQNRPNRPNRPMESGRDFGGLGYGKPIDRLPGLIPIGVHPDLIRVSRAIIAWRSFFPDR
jgi:hypothetical protein